MKKRPSLSYSIFILVVGIVMGSVFTFGMQFWNKRVERESCTQLKTQFLDYDEIRSRGSIKEIRIECTDGENYFIDGVSVNSELIDFLSELRPQKSITLLLHPNSDTIVEMKVGNYAVLEFEDTVGKLEREASGFFFLGLFMYFFAFVGLYYVIFYIRQKRKIKK